MRLGTVMSLILICFYEAKPKPPKKSTETMSKPIHFISAMAVAASTINHIRIKFSLVDVDLLARAAC